MQKHFILFTHLIKNSLKSSFSLRSAFFGEITLIVINNLLFFGLWWLFFRQFHAIKGWTLNEMTVLMAVSMGGQGLLQIFLGGIKKISHLILSSELDSFLLQPGSLLLQISGSKSFPKGWGHLLTSFFLCFFIQVSSPWLYLVLVICIFFSCLVFASIGIIAYSLPFWFGSVDSLGRKYYESFLLFSSHPTHIYKGLLQVVAFSVLPIGVIGTLPVELLKNFSFLKLGTLVLSSSAFILLAYILFGFGLKKYESGNQMTLKG